MNRPCPSITRIWTQGDSSKIANQKTNSTVSRSQFFLKRLKFHDIGAGWEDTLGVMEPLWKHTKWCTCGNKKELSATHTSSLKQKLSPFPTFKDKKQEKSGRILEMEFQGDRRLPRVTTKESFPLALNPISTLHNLMPYEELHSVGKPIVPRYLKI